MQCSIEHCNLDCMQVTHLDDFNDQYCRLAREGRLDGSDSLKLKFIGINGDWDELSDEVTFQTMLITSCFLISTRGVSLSVHSLGLGCVYKADKLIVSS